MSKTVDVADLIDSQKVSFLSVRHRLHGLADHVFWTASTISPSPMSHPH